MQVNFTMNPSGRSALHANTLYKGAQSQQAAAQARNAQRTGPAQKQDKTTISPQGKVMNIIENLVKQKENVMQQKSDLVTRTLENGKSMKSIEVQLELFEEKLSNIDEQISQATASLAEGMLEQAKEQAEKKKDKSETEEEAKTKHLSKIAYAVDGTTRQAQTISSAKTKVEGEIKIKESENKIAEIDIDRIKSKAVGTNINVEDIVRGARQMIKDKKEAVTDLKARLGTLSEMQGKAVAEDNDTLEELREDEENRQEQKAEEQGAD